MVNKAKRARHLDKLHKQRLKVIKGVKAQLKSALSAYDETHPQYKRNIKNLYEGLVRMELIDAIDNPINLKQFKEAFKNSNKSLQEALVVSNLLGNRNLDTYYSYGDKSKDIAGFKIIGNQFLVQTVNTNLEESQAIKYLLNKRKLADTIKALEELGIIKETGKQLAKDIKRGDKDVEATLGKIGEALGEYEKLFIMKRDPEQFNRVSELMNNIHKFGLGNADLLTDEHMGLRKEGLDRNVLIDQMNDEIQEIINAGRAIGRKTKNAMSTHHNLESELATKVKFKQDVLHRDQLANLEERLRLTQLQLHEKIKRNKSEEEGIPNMVEGLTDVINLKKHLQTIIEYCFKTQSSITEPGHIIGFGSGGLDKRIADMDEDEILTGNTQEGFGAKDGNDTYIRIQQFRKLLVAYLTVIPESNFKDEIRQLQSKLMNVALSFSSLRQSVSEFLIEATGSGNFTSVVRNEKGQIINFEAHTNVNRIFTDIRKDFAEVIGSTQRAFSKGDELQIYNEDLINKAKQENKSAQKALLDLARRQDKLDKIIARRKIQEIENG